MSMASAIMNNVRQFPVDPSARDDADRRVSIIFATCTIVASLGVAALTGIWVTGRIAGELGAQVEALRATLAEEHADNNRHIDQFSTLVNSLSSQVASQGAQIDALRAALAQERSDRLDEGRPARPQ